jgi:deoxycytidylate deaminase
MSNQQAGVHEVVASSGNQMLGEEPQHLDPELVIGLVGPVGTDMDAVALSLKTELLSVGYTPDVIHIIQAFAEERGFAEQRFPSEAERYKTLMKLGTDFRCKVGRGDALAVFAIGAIRQLRKEQGKGSTKPLPRHAYILRSLKHPEEVKTLRAVYGPAFFLIGAHSPRSKRVQDLAARIAASEHAVRENDFRAPAEELIARDETERDEHNRVIKLGQKVREVFPEADAFVDTSDPRRMSESIQRIVRLLFSYPFHTPTRDEQGMFFAKASALRSSSLARQVGAAITNVEGDIVVLGTNEVPKPGGGLYWEGDNPDGRDFVLGRDPSDEHRRRLLADVLRQLQKASWLSEAQSELDVETLVTEALALDPEGPIRGTRLMDLLEFIRAVHAEMAAISDAARRGIPLGGCTLYVTTFPCHECARLIVASGIKRVVYIEPFPKSLAAQLYPTAIIVEGHGHAEGHVVFEPFIGIAPRRYFDLFEMRSEKKDKLTGTAVSWTGPKATPRVPRSAPLYITAEATVITDVEPGYHSFQHVATANQEAQP